MFRFSEPLEHHQLCHFLDVIAQGGKSNSFFPHSNHRRLFCDELCQLYDVIYKTRCPTVFHTERHQSSIIGNFHIFCDRNENNDGLVVFCGDLSFHWYKDVRNRYAWEKLQGFKLSRRTIFSIFTTLLQLLTKHYTRSLKITVCP